MRRTLLGAVLVFAACASGSAQGPGANHAAAPGHDPDSGLICKEETPTGSNIPRKVCRTPEQAEDDRREAEDMLSSPHPSPSNR